MKKARRGQTRQSRGIADFLYYLLPIWVYADATAVINSSSLAHHLSSRAGTSHDNIPVGLHKVYMQITNHINNAGPLDS